LLFRAAFMKILSLSNKMPYPPKDGGTIGIYNVVDSLANAGNSVHVLAINTPKHFVSDDEIPSEVKRKLHLETVLINTNLSLFGLIKNLLFSQLPYVADRFVTKDYENRLISILTENQFDVVQIEGLYMCPYIPVIRKYSNAVISLRAHNIEHEIWERTADNSKNPFKKYYLKHMAKRIVSLKNEILNRYDVLVPVTQRDADIYEKMGNTKPVFVLPAGFDSTEMKPQMRTEMSNSLFHLGALDWVPNQEGLLWFINQCWPIIKAKLPALNFHVAGRNAPAWFVKKLDVEGIIYHGEVPVASQFINSFGVMVVPLLSGSGMRIKIVEGMAMGKVIVTTPIGTEGIPTTHRENILVADNEFSFAAEIEKVLSDEALYMKIGSNAIEFAIKHYDRNQLGKKLSEFYNSQCP